jgi:hypothetical protein
MQVVSLRGFAQLLNGGFRWHVLLLSIPEGYKNTV